MPRIVTEDLVWVSAADAKELNRLVTAAMLAAYGDSNDSEIEALQEVMECAVGILAPAFVERVATVANGNTIETDLYGLVSSAQYAAYKSAGVTTSEGEDLAKRFGNRANVAIAFVIAHTLDGQYQAPFPFPMGGR